MPAIALLAGIVALSACSHGQTTIDGFGDSAQRLRVVNRTATRIDDRNGVRLAAASGNGVAWVEGSDFQSGTIEVDVRGREFMGQSFVGVAFHRKDDKTYEVVYVRPTLTASAKTSRRSSRTRSTPRSGRRTGSSSAWWFEVANCRSTSAPSIRPRSKRGSLASSMVARSGCGWATKAAGTSRISSLHRRSDRASALDVRRELSLPEPWSCRREWPRRQPCQDPQATAGAR